MTTSYKKEAVAKLKAEKKVLREQEAAANKALNLSKELSIKISIFLKWPIGETPPIV